MTIRVLEYTVGGGRFAEASLEAFPSELRREGRAMVQALIAAASPGVRRQLRVAWDPAAGTPPADVAVDQITNREELRRWLDDAVQAGSLIDATSGDPDQTSLQTSRQALLPSGTLLIAPETDGRLYRWVTEFDSAGSRLYSPDSNFVQLTADKTATCEWLAQNGIKVPNEIDLFSEHSESQIRSIGPLTKADDTHAADIELQKSIDRFVIKRRDGCGSIEMLTGQWIAGVPTDSEARPLDRQAWPRNQWRTESWVDGVAVSLGCLSGPSGYILLPPFHQQLDSQLAYVGGRYPLSTELALRARRLAKRTVHALPKVRGYFGIDMVLGADDREDVVIEINPRLTSSWFGLAQRVGPHLTDVMLAIACGNAAANRFTLTVDPSPLDFAVTETDD